MKGSSPQIRRRARERAVQFLFGLDFTSYDWEEHIAAFWADNLSRAPVKAYAEQLVRGVVEHRAELDEAIAGALERWTPGRLGHIERNVLRIALYEMRFAEDVPESVAINEAVEVSRRFGPDDAPRFVNAVLDRLRNG